MIGAMLRLCTAITELAAPYTTPRDARLMLNVTNWIILSDSLSRFSWKLWSSENSPAAGSL